MWFKKEKEVPPSLRKQKVAGKDRREFLRKAAIWTLAGVSFAGAAKLWSIYRCFAERKFLVVRVVRSLSFTVNEFCDTEQFMSYYDAASYEEAMRELALENHIPDPAFVHRNQELRLPIEILNRTGKAMYEYQLINKNRPIKK